jgi:WhiB family redox-sensing transcriptional regulator
MAASDNRAEWWSAAACLTADPELFFPISSLGLALEQVTRAKAICSRCGIQQACLGYALDAGPVQGIWGGTTEGERQRLRRRLPKERAGLARGQAAGPALVQQAPSS